MGLKKYRVVIHQTSTFGYDIVAKDSQHAVVLAQTRFGDGDNGDECDHNPTITVEQMPYDPTEEDQLPLP